jgi:hypothetical protein
MSQHRAVEQKRQEIFLFSFAVMWEAKNLTVVAVRFFES